MGEVKKVLLLIGSPKIKESTSASIGRYLLEKLKNKKMLVEELHINSELKAEQKEAEFLEKVEKSDLIILSFPLYIDSIPAYTIRALEKIAEKRMKTENKNSQNLIAICNCGFPESSQNNIAIEICEEFAKKAEIGWLGGLAIGMGGAINGQELNKLGGMVRNIKKGLDLVVESIIKGEKISKKAIEYVGRPSIPNCLYIFMGNISWISTALKNKVFKKLGNRPY